MNLILVRHGETEWNRTERCQGISDIELNETGKRQIEALAESLREEDISAVYSSDLKRAIDTARSIARRHGLTVETNSDLREMDQGDFEGLSFDEIRENYAELLARWSETPDAVRIPRGETLKEVQRRAWRFVRSLLNKHYGDTVVAVSHNLTIITLLCRFKGIGLGSFREFNLETSSKTFVVFRNGEFRVDSIGEVDHNTDS